MLSCSCDTMVAMSDVTSDGSIIFGKNSDRQPNEPLSIRFVPSRVNPLNSRVRTTYIEIDEVEQTNSCILFTPGNMFGAEMGFNCHGLVIGNEALFTKVSSSRKALTGMDLLRLVLERCSTSSQGKNLIINLLDKYGQGGNCGFINEFYYQNSFLLVDSTEGWIIETIGKDYAAKRITNGVHTISNKISFGKIDTFDEYSENLISQAITFGWCTSIEDFHFEKCYSGFTFNPQDFYNGFIRTYFSCSSQRQSTTENRIRNQHKQFTIKDMFHLLRHHENTTENPTHGLANVDICMHSSFGPIKISQTTGSLVSMIPKSRNQIPTHFVTCSSLPCLSVFKPIWLHSSIPPPDFVRNESEDFSLTYSAKRIWWKYEVINRNIMKFYTKLIQGIENERNELEDKFIEQANRLLSNEISDEQRNSLTCSAFQEADELSEQWYRRAFHLSSKSQSELSFIEEFVWEKWRKSSKIPNQLLNYSKVPRYVRINFVVFSSLTILYAFRWPNAHRGCLIPVALGALYFLIDRFRTRDETVDNELPMLNFYS